MPRLADPTVGAGELDRRVTLLQPVYSDQYQDEIVDYAPVVDVWAGIEPQQGVETNEAGRTVAASLTAFVIRYREDIDERWRILYGGVQYRIHGMSDILMLHVKIELNCMGVGN